jgi:hypothetical protein
MIPFVWCGSAYFSGSNNWCRVVDFYNYLLAPKNFGPAAFKIYEGNWENADLSNIAEGDIIQMVVLGYAPNRYGHCLYVTKGGTSYDDIRICCHSYDRLDAPLSEFSNFPEQYPKIRIMRFKDANFIT